jgi:hypothetical protein
MVRELSVDLPPCTHAVAWRAEIGVCSAGMLEAFVRDDQEFMLKIENLPKV